MCRTQTAHLSFHSWLMICSGKTQNPDMRQIQKVVDFFFKIFILVCHSPIYSLNFVSISDKLLLFGFLCSGGLLSLPRHTVTSAEFPYPTNVASSHPGSCHRFSPVCLVQQENGFCLSPPSPHQLLIVRFFYRARIVICPWSAELQDFVFICHFFLFMFKVHCNYSKTRLL